jgi:hypothetical protein
MLPDWMFVAMGFILGGAFMSFLSDRYLYSKGTSLNNTIKIKDKWFRIEEEKSE